MIDTSRIHAFHTELTALLAKHDVDTYVLALAAHDPRNESVDLPMSYAVSGVPGISPARVSSALTEAVLGGLLRMTMQHNGLPLHQALGVLEASLPYAAEDFSAKVALHAENHPEEDDVS